MKLISMARTWSAIQMRTKTVTRRAEPWRRSSREPWEWRPTWSSLTPGQLLRAVEWTPRIGPRWACPVHGKLPSDPARWLEAMSALTCLAPGCHCGVQYRRPRLGPVIRVVATGVVEYDGPGSLDRHELLKEGFDPREDSEVAIFPPPYPATCTRIEFRYLPQDEQPPGTPALHYDQGRVCYGPSDWHLTPRLCPASARSPERGPSEIETALSAIGNPGKVYTIGRQEVDP